MSRCTFGSTHKSSSRTINSGLTVNIAGAGLAAPAWQQYGGVARWFRTLIFDVATANFGHNATFL